MSNSNSQFGTVNQVVQEARNYSMVLRYDPIGNRNRCFYQCLSAFLNRDVNEVMHQLECYMMDNETIPTMNENNQIVETSLYEFLTDDDYPLNGCKRPTTWHQAVLGLRNEMACHPVILAAATLFRVQINIIDWIGRLTKVNPPSRYISNRIYLGYTGNHYLLLEPKDPLDSDAELRQLSHDTTARNDKDAESSSDDSISIISPKKENTESKKNNEHENKPYRRFTTKRKKCKVEQFESWDDEMYSPGVSLWKGRPINVDTSSDEETFSQVSTKEEKLTEKAKDIRKTEYVDLTQTTPEKSCDNARKESKLDPSASDIDDYSSGIFQDSSSDSEPTRMMGNRTYVSQKVWNKVEAEVVEQLPPNINGTHVFKLHCPKGKNPMEVSKDMRPWKRYVPSTRSGFFGTRRLAQCGGTTECRNSFCPYLEEFGAANQKQFVKDGKDTLCMHCNTKTQHTPCNARKVWEIPKSGQLFTVYHYGDHTCKRVEKRKAQMKQSLNEAVEKFTQMPKITPTQMAFQTVSSSIEKGLSWDEIDETAENYANLNNIRYAKKKAVKQKRPHGHSFEAVSVLKKKTDEKDPFLIYEANDGSLNTSPTYVFKTSKLRLKMALNMDRHSNHFLSSEYCHFDGKHDRCKGFVTLTASVYHPVLRRMVKLAIMESEKENQENLVLFWTLLNKALKAFSNDDDTFFNPCGFICDEAGANWKSLEVVFGSEVLERTKGCEFHFMQSVHRHANKLTSRKSRYSFKKLANGLREAATPAAFQSAHSAIVSFINEKHTKRKELLKWLKWWTDRKTHISKAYRPLYNAPSSNLSEPVNSGFSQRGNTNISLVDAALEDVTESVLLQKSWEKQGSGEKTYGTGPTQAELLDKQRASQVERAHQIVDETFETLGAHTREEAYEAARIDPSCSHRPTRPTTKRKSPTMKTNRRVKRKHVSVYDDSDDYESSTSSSDEQSSSSRPRVYRKHRSATFLKTLEKAKTEKHKIAIKRDMTKTNDKENERIYEISSSTSTYTVKIGQLPVCNCLYFCNSRQLCKHIIWVYLYVLQVSEDSAIIHQMGLTGEEVKTLFKNAPEDIPENVILLPGTNNSFEAAFERHPKNKDQQEWVLTRKNHPKVAHCAGKPCTKKITKGDLHLAVNGLYCPKDNGYAVSTTYRYCINIGCCQRKGPRSNIRPLSNFTVVLDPNAKPSDVELEQVEQAGFTTKLKIRTL